MDAGLRDKILLNSAGGGSVHIFYHVDLGGYCAGAIALKYFREGLFGKPSVPIHMHKINYQDKFPWNEITEVDTVVMVDFSLVPAFDMKKLWSKLAALGEFIWIDHHKTAIESVEPSLLDSIEGVRDISKSGCELAWEYFFGDECPGLKEIPAAVKLLGRYDVWDMKCEELPWNKLILPFQEYCKSKNLDPAHKDSHDYWENFFTMKLSELSHCFDIGMVLLDYREKADRAYMAAYAVTGVLVTPVGTFTCIAVNGHARNSQAFSGFYDMGRHDLMMVYTRTKDGRWTISIYSEKVDVSEIAKSFGGGGHKGAAGFIIPFKQIEEILEVPQ